MSLLRSARFPAIVLLAAARARTAARQQPARAAAGGGEACLHRRARRLRALRRALDRGRPAGGLLLRRRCRAAVRADARRAEQSAQGTAACDRGRRRGAGADRGLPALSPAGRMSPRAGPSRRRPTSPSPSGCWRSSARVCRPASGSSCSPWRSSTTSSGSSSSPCSSPRTSTSRCSPPPSLTVVVFGALSRLLDTRARVPIAIVLVLLAVLTWVLVYESGVHATIAGVLLGLAMAQTPALRTRHAMEPWINGVVLPIFAFSAALVVIPAGVAERAVAGAVGHPGRASGRQGHRHRRRRLAVAAHRQPGSGAASGLRRPSRRGRPRRHRLHRLAAARRARLRRRPGRARSGDARRARRVAHLAHRGGDPGDVALPASMPAQRRWRCPHERSRPRCSRRSTPCTPCAIDASGRSG